MSDGADPFRPDAGPPALELLLAGLRPPPPAGVTAIPDALHRGHDLWSAMTTALRQFFGPTFPRKLPTTLHIAGPDPDDLGAFLRADWAMVAGAGPIVCHGDRFPTDPSGDLQALLIPNACTTCADADFDRLLHRCLRSLSGDGVLIFTAHDAPEDISVRPSEGLDHGSGITRMREGYVGRKIDRATDGMARWRRLPRVLLDHRDLWLVTRHPTADLDPDLDPPTGHLDGRRVDGRTLELRGWVVGGRRPLRSGVVELSVSGETAVVRATPDGVRPDLGSLYGQAAGAFPTAFRLVWQADREIDPATPVRVDAVDGEDGGRRVLYIGPAGT